MLLLELGILSFYENSLKKHKLKNFNFLSGGYLFLKRFPILAKQAGAQQG